MSKLVDVDMGQVAALTDDDVTDGKFRLDDSKRKLAQELLDVWKAH